MKPARRASAAFLKTLKSAYLEPDEFEPPLAPLNILRDEGIPTANDPNFLAATSQINKRRRLLLSLVKNDGWTWDAVASTQTTSRAASLDDNTTIDSRVLH